MRAGPRTAPCWWAAGTAPSRRPASPGRRTASSWRGSTDVPGSIPISALRDGPRAGWRRAAGPATAISWPKRSASSPACARHPMAWAERSTRGAISAASATGRSTCRTRCPPARPRGAGARRAFRSRPRRPISPPPRSPATVRAARSWPGRTCAAPTPTSTSSTWTAPARSWRGWPATGLGIAVVPGAQSAPVIVGDGAGGVFVAWQDRRAANDDVYLQHVTGGGALAAGWAANGIAVCNAPGDQRGISMVGDDASGVFIAWQDHRALDWDLYALRVLGNAVRAPGWVANGVAVTQAGDDQLAVRAARDGAHGVLLAWQDHRGADWDVYALRLAADASVAPARSEERRVGKEGRSRWSPY